MIEPLAWNTLQEAAEYLTAKTGVQWTPRSILSKAWTERRNRPNGAALYTFVGAAPPLATRFVFCLLDAGAQPNPFVPQHEMPWQTVPLLPNQIKELLGCGETIAALAQRPVDNGRMAEEYVIIDPPLAVNINMLGMNGNALHWLATAAVGAIDPSLPSSPVAPSTDDARGPQQKATDWKQSARRLADKCFDQDTANNCRDSLAGYSQRVMDEMQKQRIHGPRGLIDNPRTIQRDALQGQLWWQGKKK